MGISQIIVLDLDSYVINFMLFDNRAVTSVHNSLL